MWTFSLLMCLSFATRAFAGKVCCERIGCFDINKDHPMGHLPDPKCPDDIGLKFVLVTRKSHDMKNYITVDNVPKEFDGSKLTIFTSHGWMGQADMDWTNELADKLLGKYDANVIVADWKRGARKIYYPKAAANTLTVGAEAAHLLKGLVKNHGATFDNMWCIGFSLGAHVCGHAGMLTDGQMSRVTGLDPAGPSFHKRNIMNGLNPTSGKFVDVVHGDGDGIVSYYGLMERRGHADFYPNGGRDQPGCYFGRRRRDAIQTQHELECIDFNGWVDPETCPYNIFIGCDHYRAIYYFMDTLTIDSCHVARKVCTSYEKMPRDCVDTDTVVHMGADADRTKHGMFYLETEKRSPYCKY